MNKKIKKRIKYLYAYIMVIVQPYTYVNKFKETEFKRFYFNIYQNMYHIVFLFKYNGSMRKVALPIYL